MHVRPAFNAEQLASLYKGGDQNAFIFEVVKSLDLDAEQTGDLLLAFDRVHTGRGTSIQADLHQLINRAARGKAPN